MVTKGKNVIKIIVSIILTVIIFSFGQVCATNYYFTNKSSEFQTWENLSQEEQESTIQPTYNYLQIEDSLKRSTYNKLLGDTDQALENKYLIQNLTVKNQLKTNLCWTFSFSSILESNVEKKYGIEIEYSPLYTDYMVVNNSTKTIGNAGNFLIAVASATSGNGVGYESDMPFLNYYDEAKNSKENYYVSYDSVNKDNLIPRAKILKTINFANINKSINNGNITYKKNDIECTESEVNVVRQQIKKHIKEYGALTSYTYINTNGIQTGDYFNNDTKAYYNDNSFLGMNHAITIVGWDDTFSKTNFKEGKQPIHDGAYIGLNSWGKGFGIEGYYYISYDDVSVEQNLCGIVNIQEFSKDSDKGYDNIYQYDELGMSYGSRFLNEKYTECLTEGYLANVFTRKDTSKREVISEIGIFVPITEGIEIYVDNENGDIKDYKKVASYTGTNALEPGYHNLKLSSPIELSGTEFSVIVKYINQENAVYAIECNLLASGLAESDLYFRNVKANKGESYISTDGKTWCDINEYKVPKSSTELTTYKNTNACIKAFTTILAGDTPIAVTGINLNKTKLTLEEGKTETLISIITPSDATNKNVIWSSSNTDIATVNGGVVTAKKVGETTITVATQDGVKKAECKVTVVAKKSETIGVQSINLSKTVLSLEEGKTETLISTITPSDATNKNVTWSSSNTNIAIVNGGVITAKKVGETTITVTTQDGEKKAECKVFVNKAETIKVQSISLSKTILLLEEGKTETLISTITPSNATNKNVTWSSSNTDIATVDGGVITAKKVGETTITVTTQDGVKKAECKVVVNESETIFVKKITLNKTKETVEVGDTINLIATLEPSNATNQKVIWNSSDETVATINQNGIISAIKEGVTTIKVVSQEGKTEAFCELTVKSKTNKDDDIYKEDSNKNDDKINKNIETKDNTRVKENLPDTGVKIIIITLGILLGFVIVKFVRYKVLKVK